MCCCISHLRANEDKPLALAGIEWLAWCLELLFRRRQTFFRT